MVMLLKFHCDGSSMRWIIDELILVSIKAVVGDLAGPAMRFWATTKNFRCVVTCFKYPTSGVI